jgi:outer membrane lipoprotein carrier protein
MSNSPHPRASKPAVALVRVALVAVCVWFAEPAAANGPSDDPCAESLAQRVQAHYEGVRDVVARFVQTSRAVAFTGLDADAEPSRGEVWLAKPGRMRWSYETPERSLVVSDGATLWIYDPVAKEVQILAVDEGFLSGAAIQFLLGEGRILETYRVDARGCEGTEATLGLVPRAASTYERLELSVDPATGAVRATAVVDLFGNRTEVALENVRTNQGVEAGLFRFEPPEGVRVLTIPGP